MQDVQQDSWFYLKLVKATNKSQIKINPHFFPFFIDYSNDLPKPFVQDVEVVPNRTFLPPPFVSIGGSSVILGLVPPGSHSYSDFINKYKKFITQNIATKKVCVQCSIRSETALLILAFLSTLRWCKIFLFHKTCAEAVSILREYLFFLIPENICSAHWLFM